MGAPVCRRLPSNGDSQSKLLYAECRGGATDSVDPALQKLTSQTSDKFMVFLLWRRVYMLNKTFTQKILNGSVLLSEDYQRLKNVQCPSHFRQQEKFNSLPKCQITRHRPRCLTVKLTGLPLKTATN